jgi:hypothetical protein
MITPKVHHLTGSTTTKANSSVGQQGHPQFRQASQIHPNKSGPGPQLTGVPGQYDPRQRISPYSPREVATYAAIAGNQNMDDSKKQFKIQFPMEPRAALMNLGKCLHDFEKTEILEYDTIYFLNLMERKTKGL